MNIPIGLERRHAPLIAIGMAGIVLGALLGGNLFTFITGEYSGVGPGFGQNIGFKVDTVTKINTKTPEYYVTGPLRIIAPWLITWTWQFTGKMWVEPDGSYTILWSRHAGVLFNDGKDWIEDQISDSPSAVDISKYISLSRSSASPAATWSKIFDEINTGGGLDRVAGTYASTGVGQWTVTKQFTADAGYTNVQLTGLCWDDTDDSNDTTLCADTFTPVTLANGDKITVTWTITVS